MKFWKPKRKWYICVYFHPCIYLFCCALFILMFQVSFCCHFLSVRRTSFNSFLKAGQSVAVRIARSLESLPSLPYLSESSVGFIYIMQDFRCDKGQMCLLRASATVTLPYTCLLVQKIEVIASATCIGIGNSFYPSLCLR